MTSPQILNFQAFNDFEAQNPKKQYSLLIKIVVVIFVFLFIFVCFYKELVELLVLGIVGIAIYAVTLSNKRGKKVAACLDLFAKDNGLIFTQKLNYVANGVVFSAGNNDHITNYFFQGKLLGYGYCFYQHRFTTGQGKYRIPHYFGVVEIDLSKNLPHIFLDKKENNVFGKEVLDEFKNKNIISLEGDFSNNFRVFAAKEYETETLTILNPSFMSKLIDLKTPVDIEIIDNKLFLYFKNKGLQGWELPKSEIILFHETAEYILNELQKSLDTFRFNVHENIPNRIEKSAFNNLLTKEL